jgi:hypothetical protein
MHRIGTAVVAAALAAIAGVGTAASSGFDGTWQANGSSVGGGAASRGSSVSRLVKGRSRGS